MTGETPGSSAEPASEYLAQYRARQAAEINDQTAAFDLANNLAPIPLRHGPAGIGMVAIEVDGVLLPPPSVVPPLRHSQTPRTSTGAELL